MKNIKTVDQIIQDFEELLIPAMQMAGPPSGDQIASIMRVEKACAERLRELTLGENPPTLYESGAALVMLMGTWVELCNKAAAEVARNAANN